MMTLRQLAAEPPTLPTRTTWYLTDLAEARGKQELFTCQSPQKLKMLREHALIESAITRQPGDFSVSDIQKECPGVGVDLIRQVLKRLKDDTQVVCLGRGHTAKWRKAGK